MNPTLEKFGYPHNLLFASDHWAVLLRPAQVTLGALIIGSRSRHLAFGDLPGAAFEDLGRVAARVEAVLKAGFNYQKINYLMLMMVDPHVHFHAIPRYAVPPEFAGVRFIDSGWPGPPDLADATALETEQFEQLRTALRGQFQAHQDRQAQQEQPVQRHRHE